MDETLEQGKVKIDFSSLIIEIIKAVVFLWDFITYPIYEVIYKRSERKKRGKEPNTKCLSQFTTDSQMVFESSEKTSTFYSKFIKTQSKTIGEAWNWAVKTYKSKPALGTREILKEEDEIQKSGKVFKKYNLGDYRWQTYEDVDYNADYLGRGLRCLNLCHGQNICIFADTRAEWFITAQACFKQGYPIVTLYTNLGDEAIVHGINETEVTHIVTTHELLPKFRKILPKTPNVTHVIYMEHQVERTIVDDYPENVQILPLFDVIHTGKKLSRAKENMDPIPPTEDDAAIIMYTSGSTGIPKGVIISHRNLLATATGMMQLLNEENSKIILEGKEIYLAYLPLAHVLELLQENVNILYGMRIGYSTPNTLTDKSTMVKRGCKGDATVLQPTYMTCVPLILDRIYKGATELVSKGGNTFQKVFQWAYDYRLKALRAGKTTPILDAIVFKPFRAQLGGNIKVIVTGGAPLSGACHDFIRVCMGAPVLQGYALTETTACATAMQDMHDFSTTGKCGAPIAGAQIKLVNWEEGNYRVTDKPNPRGEIHIGGNFISDGYYKNEEKTKEEFYHEYGRKWFKSGDIGEMDSDGQIRIIDRKKDLCKLQIGEYVSFGKVEAVLNSCPVVENVCIYGDSLKSFCVALVSPNQKNLKDLAKKYGKEDLAFDQMCTDRDVTGSVFREIVNHSKKLKLEKFEIPGAVTVVKEVWTPDNGFLTSAMKIKRKPIQDFYQSDINRMYGVS